jgi:hypothetical protein
MESISVLSLRVKIKAKWSIYFKDGDQSCGMTLNVLEKCVFLKKLFYFIT